MRLAILDDFQDAVLSATDWSSLAKDIDITVFNDHLGKGDALFQRIEPFDIIVVNRECTPIPRSIIERLPNLKLIVTGGMRNRSIDLAAAREYGIDVCGTESFSSATAELTWSLILAVARNLRDEAQSLREGGWQVGLGMELQGKTLGILGLGRQGSAVAAIGKAFGMHVVAWSQNLNDERCAECGVRRLASKSALLAESDILTIHLVLSERTRGLIGRNELAQMKPGAYLINTSRGAIVDESALVEAVRSGAIAGAGLDVFDEEPLPEAHAYRGTPGILATPHLGYVTRENYASFYGQGVENIRAWLARTPIRVLNPSGA